MSGRGGIMLLSFEVLGSRCYSTQIVTAYRFFSKISGLNIIAELGIVVYHYPDWSLLQCNYTFSSFLEENTTVLKIVTEYILCKRIFSKGRSHSKNGKWHLRKKKSQGGRDRFSIESTGCSC